MKELCFSIMLIMVAGCGTNELSPLQRRTLESRTLEGKYDDAFKATIQVLQDEGYIIKNADINSGVVQGETGQKKSKNYFLDGLMFNFEITATLEQFGENNVKERISLIRKSKNEYGGEGPSKVVAEPDFFQRIYDNIQKEMFIRQNLNK